MIGDDLIVVIGGYGKSNTSCHMRLGDVLLLNFSSLYKSIKVLSITGHPPGKYMYHSFY